MPRKKKTAVEVEKSMGTLVPVPEGQDMELATQRDYQGAVKKTLELFHQVSDSIGLEDIIDMDPRHKFQALRDLNYILTEAKAKQPRSVTLNNINIRKADVDELEKAMNDYTVEQEG